jgi:L-Ala-D/L-Glu epimerase
MNAIVSASLLTAELRFRAPFVTSRGSLAVRRVYYVVLNDADGRRGIGEAAPLEEFGTESTDACDAALRAAIPRMIGIDPTAITLDETGVTAGSSDGALTARYAIETALLDLCARQSGIGLARLISGLTAPFVLVNAVISAGSIEATADAAEAAREAGFSCLKIKVGAETLDRDVLRVSAAASAAGEDVLLRLDANGAWDIGTARDALDRFAPFNVEYIEQPVAGNDTGALASLARNSPIPIAADESIFSIDRAYRLLAADACDVFILKPMALGGLLACRRFADAAAAQWKKVVFTSLLDSAVGRHAVAHLAAALPAGAQHHHGLATGALLASDVYVDDVRGGVLTLPGGAGLGFDPDLSGCRVLAEHGE